MFVCGDIVIDMILVRVSEFAKGQRFNHEQVSDRGGEGEEIGYVDKFSRSDVCL